MHDAQMRTIPHLPQLTFGMLTLGGLLFAALLWSMFR
jgi:hypothetical protein